MSASRQLGSSFSSLRAAMTTETVIMAPPGRPCECASSAAQCVRVSEPFQGSVVRSNCLTHRLLVVIRHAVLHCRVAYDSAEGRVMSAAHLGKQMVLDLMVQPADIPRQDSI